MQLALHHGLLPEFQLAQIQSKCSSVQEHVDGRSLLGTTLGVRKVLSCGWDLRQNEAIFVANTATKFLCKKMKGQVGNQCCAVGVGQATRSFICS